MDQLTGIKHMMRTYLAGVREAGTRAEDRWPIKMIEQEIHRFLRHLCIHQGRAQGIWFEPDEEASHAVHGMPEYGATIRAVCAAWMESKELPAVPTPAAAAEPAPSPGAAIAAEGEQMLETTSAPQEMPASEEKKTEAQAGKEAMNIWPIPPVGTLIDRIRRLPPFGLRCFDPDPPKIAPDRFPGEEEFKNPTKAREDMLERWEFLMTQVAILIGAPDPEDYEGARTWLYNKLRAESPH
jgi:hypothetical protein